MRAVLVALLLPAALASANGRAPQTNGVYIGPSQDTYVRSTFGLLVTRDSCSFRWICEQAIGYAGDFDPKYAIAADGTLFATTYGGLRVSRDGGCTWMTATDPIWIDAIDIGPTGEVWAASAETAAASDVYRSTDNGHTFQHRGMLSASIWWKSVKVAPSNAQRVYLTGYEVSGSTPAPHLMRTDTGGESWIELPTTGVLFNPTPIAQVRAVDPGNADLVYLVSIGANDAGDRMYRSTDAGMSWTEVLATTSTIRDVVYHAGAMIVATTAGAWTSADGVAFAPLANPPQLACLADRGGTLVGCGANWDPDFMSVGTSPDAATWTKIFRFVELDGPLQCPAGTPAHDMCEPLWPMLQQQFGAKGSTCAAPVDAPPTKPPPPAGCCSVDDADMTPPIGASIATLVTSLWILRRRRPLAQRCASLRK